MNSSSVSDSSGVTAKGRPIWTTKWCWPFESGLSRLLKYAWTNVAALPELNREIFNRPYHPNTTERSRELFFGNWIKWNRVGVPAELLSAEGFAAHYGRQWMTLLCRQDAIRYCSYCLQEGFHSLLQQIEALEYCPRHSFMRLQDSCLKCCKPTPPLALDPNTFEHPFCCPHCLKPMGFGLEPKKWIAAPSAVAEVEKAFKPIETWLKALGAFEHRYKEAPLSELELDPERDPESPRLTCFSIARKLVGAPFGVHVRSTRPFMVSRGRVSKRPPPPLHPLDTLDQEITLFFKLHSFLKGTRLSDHKDCLREARGQILTLSSSQGSFMVQAPGLCAAAAGFRRWEQRFWIRERWMRARYGKWGGHNARAMDPRFKELLLADFVHCVAIAHVHEMLRRRMTPREFETDPRFGKLLQSSTLGDPETGAYWRFDNLGDPPDLTVGSMVMGDILLVEHVVCPRIASERPRKWLPRNRSWTLRQFKHL